ncbi:UvrD-helicase domain-containing protein [Methylobacterium indicum]|uniref:UvrD-helicase domain-containing protein n=1 Tax=Methylobacterium indicum TaxID=1775910 RepID=UPI002435D263|nr:UvrD-helicase domain-containing protein [Methylobacterium indicum]
MSIDTLIVDQNALATLDSALVEDSWFTNFDLPENYVSLKRVRLGGRVYLLSREVVAESGLLVIDLKSTKLLTGETNLRYRFERVLRVATRHFSREVVIPIKWQLFHHGSLISVYGDPIAKQSGFRIYFDQAPEGERNIFAYGSSVGPIRDFLTIEKNDKVYKNAIEDYETAALTEVEVSANAGHLGIVLAQPLGAQFSGSATLEDWYEKRLTVEQRKFVDCEHRAPVRLRGAAGTGKTQAVAIKVLKDLYAAETKGADTRIAVITHSSALAHEVIRGMFYALDPTAKWQKPENASLWTGTLYELAQETLQYERKGLEPLSLDGRDGRELQKLLIGDALDAVAKSPRLKLSVLGKCSQNLRSRVENPAERPALIKELANEFACVIEADNIRKGTKESEKYLNGSRDAWQMQLEAKEDRVFALEVHEIYENGLMNQNLLSMDQMIADFSRYLATHEWRQLKERKGFDVVFVDEFHYFNRLEVMTFHNLFRKRAMESGNTPLFMAYDFKQSPNDTSLNAGGKNGAAYFKMAASGKTELVEFKTVFRSTPQIANFLKDLDKSFPAIGLEDEWQTYNAGSSQDPGDTPKLIVYETNEKLIDSVISSAITDIRSNKDGGRQVAVLCLNEHLFDIYRNSGRIKDKIVALTSRDQMGDLQYARSRCIFSMPEFVAGLQFDVVYLIHADRAELAEERYSAGLHRRVVSRCYLGASRAAKKLVIAASEERGGRSNILCMPLKERSLAD